MPMSKRVHLVLGISLFAWGANGVAQGVDLTATLAVAHTAAGPHKSAQDAALNDVVLWLTPADPTTPAPINPLPRSGYRLIQKNKMFSPHLLVVPAGSSVEFPNLDPFFHNVFSLFNGKRFDLGLYEAGSKRSVRFDREGVSYIFCNIHPEMGAIVLALATPYYAISNAAGAIVLHGVPPGAYRVHVWSEHYQPSHPETLAATLHVAAQPVSLGPIELTAAADPLTHHMNKFGEEYPPAPHPDY